MSTKFNKRQLPDSTVYNDEETTFQAKVLLPIATPTDDKEAITFKFYKDKREEIDTEISLLKNPDRITVNAGYTLLGQDLTFNPDWKVVIDAVEYTNTAQVILNFPLASAGCSRLDLVAFTKDSTFVRVAGVESLTTPVAPSTPPDTVYITVVFVSDVSVNEPEPPQVDGAYIKKSELANVILNGTGLINMLALTDEKATVVFKDAITRLNTISYASVPYNGKRITLFNAQATPVTIGHSVSGYGVDFVFPDGQDYILLPNQTIEFSFDTTYAPYVHHMLIGSKGITNWSELQEKPTTFPPSAHNHTILEVTGLQGELDARIVDSQIEVSSSTYVLVTWDKKTILFTANCTITVPATLLSQFGFVFRTLAGVTVTWAITAPFTWETTPTITPEKTTGSFMRRGSTNTILLDF